MTEDENRLEPRRRTRCPSPMRDPTSLNVDLGHAPTPDNDRLWNHREAEKDLENRPFVTRYPGGMASCHDSTATKIRTLIFSLSHFPINHPHSHSLNGLVTLPIPYDSYSALKAVLYCSTDSYAPLEAVPYDT